MSLITLASLALAGTAAAHPGMKASRQIVDASNATIAGNMTLAPIAANLTTPTVDAFAPVTDVVLPYGLNNTNFVNITLTVPSAVLLESIAQLTAVDCASDSVSLTFAAEDDVNNAFTQWSAVDSLVLITNHLGDCDTENERGFFLANTYTISDLTLVAGVEKTNVTNFASYMRANFTGIPGATNAVTSTGVTKRDIVADPDAVTLSTSWDLPALTLYELDPYIKATANNGSISAALTLDGYLDFDIWTFSLDALYVDVSTATSVDLELGLAVGAAYNNTFEYGDSVAYYVVDVPGILSFGPALSFAVGAAVDVDAAVDVTLDVGAALNGSVHLDFVGSETAAVGWEPTYYANLTLSQEAAVGVTPYVSVTVALEFEILGGLLDLSGGLTPKVEFPLNATLSAGQTIDAAGSNVTVSQVPADGVCVNGVQLTSDFVFTLDAFVTQFYDVELYSVTVPIADECYSWA